MKGLFKMAAIIPLFVFLSFAVVAQSPCADLKNKTYVAFGETIWDQPLNATVTEGAFAFRIKFNADGTRGEARFMTAYKLSDSRAVQQKMIFECKPGQNGKNSQFVLTEKASGDNGWFIFKTFDRGARVRVKSSIPARGTPFWMIEAPPEPNPEPLPAGTN